MQNETCPEDYPYRFLLQTTDRVFFLHAATKGEREIWVHDFSNFMETNKETDNGHKNKTQTTETKQKPNKETKKRIY